MLQATRITLGLLAHRIGQLSEQIREVDARLARLVKRHAPQLLEVVGIGPDTAVALLITVGDNPERLGSEASFAALCGAVPSSAPRGTGSSAVSTAAATVRPTPRSTASCSPAFGLIRARRTTTSAGSRRARPGGKSSCASSAMRPGRSSTSSNGHSQDPAHSPLDRLRRRRGCRRARRAPGGRGADHRRRPRRPQTRYRPRTGSDPYRQLSRGHPGRGDPGTGRCPRCHRFGGPFHRHRPGLRPSTARWGQSRDVGLRTWA